MALNHILYRPQVLERPISDADGRLIEELMEMASRLLADALKGGPAREKLLEGVNEAMANLVADVQARLNAASTSLMNWLEPIIQALQMLVNSMGDINSSAAGVHTVAQVILFLADLMSDLSSTAIAAKLNALLDIITDDLGLTRARLTAFLNDAIDIVVQKMKADFLAGNHTEQSHNEYLIGAYLEKVKRIVADVVAEFDFELDLPGSIAKLTGFLENLDWDRLRAAAEKMLTDVGNTVESLGILMDIFSGKFNVTVTVTANANAPGPAPVNDPVSWYATWFNRIFGWTETVGVVDRSRLDNEPFFNTMSFRQSWLPPTTMEHMAHVSDIVADGVEAVLHLTSIRKKDWIGNSAHATLQALRALLMGLLADSDDQTWVDAHKFFGNPWGEALTQFGTSVLTGMESMHWDYGNKQGIFYLTLAGKDWAESVIYSNWVARLRQGLLSFFTLLNADPIGVTGSQNHHKVAGFSMLVSEIASWLFALSSGRKGFGMPGHGRGKAAYAGWLFLGIGGSIVGATTGWLLSWLISHSQQPEGTDSNLTLPNGESYGFLFLEALLGGALKQLGYQYLLFNGDTDGGKMGQDGSYNFKTFKGYPPKATSPYLLPYPQGEVRQCAQTNNGIWSHHHNTNQIYAFDWDHDHDMEVLCVRDGTVGNWRDIIPDHSTMTDNNIDIDHDRTAPDPIHDRDWQTDGVLTTANYIHGAHFSVRHIFAAMGVPRDNITGTPVDQGMLVMFSGDTGTSFYNHLHMHVGSPNSMSIPWVFRDADAPDNGVLNDLVWYESDNQRKPDVTGLTVAHPAEQETLGIRFNVRVRSTGAKTVRIDFNGAWRDHGAGAPVGTENSLKGLSLRWEMPNGTIQHQRITGNTKQAGTGTAAVPLEVNLTLKDNWNPAPAVGQRMNILGLTGTSTSNTITLCSYAREHDDTYTGRFILVWWQSEDDATVYQYKKITSYDAGDRKVTIDGSWDRQPPAFARYEVGGKSYSDSNAFYRRFAFVPGGPDAAPARTLHQVARSYAGHFARPVSVPANNKLILAVTAPTTAPEVVGHAIAIYSGWPSLGGNRVLAYTMATAYNPGTRELTVADSWPVTIQPATHYYAIGGPLQSVASAEERQEIAFICPDTNANTFSPTDFPGPNAGPPYTSQTFKTW